MRKLLRSRRIRCNLSGKRCKPGQNTSLAFSKRCDEAGVRPSMGSVADTTTTFCESFFSAFGCELLDRRRFASQADAQTAVFSFIEGFYNPVRLPL